MFVAYGVAAQDPVLLVRREIDDVVGLAGLEGLFRRADAAGLAPAVQPHVAVCPVELAGLEVEGLPHRLVGPDHPQIRIEKQDELGHGVENDRLLLFGLSELFDEPEVFLIDLRIGLVGCSGFFHSPFSRTTAANRDVTRLVSALSHLRGPIEREKGHRARRGFTHPAGCGNRAGKKQRPQGSHEKPAAHEPGRERNPRGRCARHHRPAQAPRRNRAPALPRPRGRGPGHRGNGRPGRGRHRHHGGIRALPGGPEARARRHRGENRNASRSGQSAHRHAPDGFSPGGPREQAHGPHRGGRALQSPPPRSSSTSLRRALESQRRISEDTGRHAETLLSSGDRISPTVSPGRPFCTCCEWPAKTARTCG